MASPAGSDEDALLDKKEAPPARPAWDPVPAAAPGHYCAVMGDEALWPPLPGSKVTHAAAPSSSADPAAPQQSTKATTSKESLGASSSVRHGDRAPPVPERRAADQSSSSSPMHVSNNHVNGGAGFRGRQNNGRFVQHPHGGGYNNGSRRPVGGANNGRGRSDVNVHVHINGNNFNGGGGFNNNNGQRRGGRSHPNGHWHGQGHKPSGPHQMAHMEPPHGYPQLPPFMAPIVPPPVGFYDPYYYGYEYASPGYYFLPAQEGFPFMPYPALPMHMMPPYWEQQGGAFGPSSSMEQQEQQEAPQQDDPAEMTAEELQESIRTQIEYYFSMSNLPTDTYLRSKMDEHGWVPLSVIAEFHLVKRKSDDLDFIMNSVLTSDEVEVQEGKIRKRGWDKYMLQGNN